MTTRKNHSDKSQRAPSSSTGSNQHQRTRRDHANETAEDYVEAISIIAANRGTCRLTDLAKHFVVSHVTASKILARLDREGLVATVPYAPVKLTEAGERLARHSRKRHEIVVAFLLALGVQTETAEVDAEGIEHHVSQETLACMLEFTRQKNTNAAS